jgi:hypothetical protein
MNSLLRRRMYPLFIIWACCRSTEHEQGHHDDSSTQHFIPTIGDFAREAKDTITEAKDTITGLLGHESHKQVLHHMSILAMLLRIKSAMALILRRWLWLGVGYSTVPSNWLLHRSIPPQHNVFNP